MKESEILQHLEEIAEKLSIKVQQVNLRKDYYNLKSGLCKVRGEPRIIVDKHLHLSEKIDVLIDALAEFDIEDLYINPYVRKLFEKRSTEAGGSAPLVAEKSPVDTHPSP
jgi:3'-phosphoadenosine 5'-phosphosulfate sulfotransferase (PAPS reductase)/FAD synthetase